MAEENRDANLRYVEANLRVSNLNFEIILKSGDTHSQVWSTFSLVIGLLSAAFFILSNEITFVNLDMSDPDACSLGPKTGGFSLFIVIASQVRRIYPNYL